MGHLLFLVLHLVALLFFPLALFVTLSLHAIYGVISSKRVDRPAHGARRTCPACKEQVLREATVCKHCGGSLLPDELPPLKPWYKREI